MQRRDFLKDSSVAMTALAAFGLAPRSDAGAAPRRVGLQLFTVMRQLEADLEGTLRAVAAIGYKEVETIGAFGRDPRQMRELLDKYGLTSPSQHLVPGDLYEWFREYFRHPQSSDKELGQHWADVMSVDKVEPIIGEGISRAQQLGQKFLVWQIIWPQQLATRALIDRFSEALNQGAQICAREGMSLCFHNHALEFQRVDNIVPYEVIVENTVPALKLEADFYWMTKAGVDPAACFKKYPDRYRQCHLKDSTRAGEMTTVGRGIVDFPRLLGAARAAGIEHFYVEYDRAEDPMQSTRDSYAYLARMLERSN